MSKISLITLYKIDIVAAFILTILYAILWMFYHKGIYMFCGIAWAITLGLNISLFSIEQRRVATFN